MRVGDPTRIPHEYMHLEPRGALLEGGWGSRRKKKLRAEITRVCEDALLVFGTPTRMVGVRMGISIVDEAGQMTEPSVRRP